tara:strand:+ start:16132 stop:16356 length:225 start_codon:yes stop_codon:yes gene_type:complete
MKGIKQNRIKNKNQKYQQISPTKLLIKNLRKAIIKDTNTSYLNLKFQPNPQKVITKHKLFFLKSLTSKNVMIDS